MKIHHSRYHWISVALVLAALLFMLSEAHGQSTGSAAVFEGRPSMAGAQGGLGAQAGPPQGGLGVQGSDAAQRTIAPRQDIKPSGDQGMKPARDQSIAKDQRSAVKKVKKAAKRAFSRNRQGINPIDASNQGAR